MKKIFTLVLFLLFLLFPVSILAEDISLSYRGGVYHTPVTLNRSVRLEFVVDSGAASVLIPNDVFKTLLRTRTISESDFLGSSKVETATGEVIDVVNINIRELTIGSQTIYNVEASIGGGNASLLLGQSALRKLEPWSLNTSKGILTIRSSSLSANAPEYGYGLKEITRDETLAFIDSCVSMENSRDLSGALSLFSDRVDYFAAGNVSKDFIYKDKYKYFERWPSNQTKFLKIIGIQNLADSKDTVKVTYTIHFDVYNHNKQKGIQGQAKNTVILKKENGIIRIVSAKQKVLKREKY